MKKNFLAPNIRVSAVKVADILTTSNIYVGDKAEGTEGHPYVDDAAVQERNIFRYLAH